MLLFLLLRLEMNPVERIEFVELDLYLSFNEGRISLDSLVKCLKALVKALLSNVLAQGYGWLMNCSLDCYISNFEVGVFHGEELGAADRFIHYKTKDVPGSRVCPLGELERVLLLNSEDLAIC
jgi:hypothetical protein